MFHLVCVHPFQHPQTGKPYAKGDMITDAAEVAMLQVDRDHHFNRLAAPEEPEANAPLASVSHPELPAL